MGRKYMDINFDSTAPVEGVDVKDTNMLKPGAREKSEFTSGESNLKKDFKKKGSFGQLGSRGYGGNNK